MAAKKILFEGDNNVRMSIGISSGICLVRTRSHQNSWVVVSDRGDLNRVLEKLQPIDKIEYLGPRLNHFSDFQSQCESLAISLKSRFISGSETLILNRSDTSLFADEELESAATSMPDVKQKVLIIDDSDVVRKILRKLIDASGRLTVMGEASCPSEAKKIIETSKPDLITLDIHMPEMNGVEFLKSYLSQFHIPTVMISSVSVSEGPLVLEALANGAATYIEKPSLSEIQNLKETILSKIEAVLQAAKSKKSSNKQISRPTIVSNFSHFNGLIAIGSSTGGTQALEHVFCSLPDEIPPIVVVQHIPAVFSKALAERLNGLCKFQIQEAVDGLELQKNNVYIAPGGKQMKVLGRRNQLYIQVNDDPPMNRFQPSVDYLFNSLAEVEKTNQVGVILTGMGRDGAQGLLQMRNSGAITIGQDEESSIVYGMPRVAFELGAVENVASLNNIAMMCVKAFNRLA